MKKDMVITLARDDIRIWKEEEYDDYSYEGTVFVVKKNGEWIGIYNMKDVISIEVGLMANEFLIAKLTEDEDEDY